MSPFQRYAETLLLDYHGWPADEWRREREAYFSSWSAECLPDGSIAAVYRRARSPALRRSR